MTTSLKHPAAPDLRRGERGYALVALIAACTILALVVATAAPSLQQQAQREREKESIARGEEIADAIATYTQLMGRLPASMDDLVKGITPIGSIKTTYILRREAARDLLSSSGEWKLVRANEVQRRRAAAAGDLQELRGAAGGGHGPRRSQEERRSARRRGQRAERDGPFHRRRQPQPPQVRPRLLRHRAARPLGLHSRLPLTVTPDARRRADSHSLTLIRRHHALSLARAH
jgi:Tfp pilus assembly protein PilE